MMTLRRSLVLVPLLAVFATSCSDRAEYSPTGLGSADLVTFADMRAQTLALFPWTDNRAEPPLRLIRDIRNALSAVPPKTALAQSLMFELVDYTLANFQGGFLLDPNGANAPTTAEAVCEYIRDAFEWVGLPRPATCPDGTESAAAVIDAGGGLVVTGEGQAGTSIPPGAFNQSVLLVITPLPDPDEAGEGPLNTDLKQFGRFYDITVTPDVPLTADMLVGLCVYDPPNPLAPPARFASRLQLAHNVGEGLEILDLAPAPFLTCPVTEVNPEQSGALLDRFVKFAVSVFAPRELFAASLNPGGVGGLAKSFSPFGAVDPFSGQDGP